MGVGWGGADGLHQPWPLSTKGQTIRTEKSSHTLAVLKRGREVGHDTVGSGRRGAVEGRGLRA